MLEQFGNFCDAEVQLFKNHIHTRYLNKNEILSKEGDVSTSMFYIVNGSFYQYFYNEAREEEIITDLHIEKDWVFNLQSLVNQQPSKVSIKAFERSEVSELTLENLHKLIAVSQKFLQFNRLLSISNSKIDFYDEQLKPAEKYDLVLKTRPELIQKFPLSLIASYLKMRPETLSRVRANVSF
jgi:CRP-like cAMP-binding protein